MGRSVLPCSGRFGQAVLVRWRRHTHPCLSDGRNASRTPPACVSITRLARTDPLVALWQLWSLPTTYAPASRTANWLRALWRPCASAEIHCAITVPRTGFFRGWQALQVIDSIDFQLPRMRLIIRWSSVQATHGLPPMTKRIEDLARNRQVLFRWAGSASRSRPDRKAKLRSNSPARAIATGSGRASRCAGKP